MRATTPSAIPHLASFTELLRTAVRACTTSVTEGSRRNARAALSARTDDAAAADRLLASLAPAAAPALIRRRSA